MLSTIIDTQSVAEPSSASNIVFTLTGAAPELLVTLHNVGDSSVVWKFQEYTGTAWADIEVADVVVGGTLAADARTTVKVSSATNKIRLHAEASGGSLIDYSIQRTFAHTPGSALPVFVAHSVIYDTQTIAGSESTVFTFTNNGNTDFLITLKNSGVNTLNYRFQEFNGKTWVDSDDLGSDRYNTLMQGQVRHMKVDSKFPNLRLVSNASGGATLDYIVCGHAGRPAGETIIQA